MLQLIICIIALFAVIVIAYAETEYKTEKVCEIITSKSGEREYCRRVLVPEKKSNKETKSDKK